MDIAKDIRDRITMAAGALYEEAERSDFPTVAAVRARASVDMNAASIVMREWRRAQTAQAAPLAVEVPEKVRASYGPGLGRLAQVKAKYDPANMFRINANILPA